MTEKIIIDTDPGIDDAMAILAALHSPDLEVVGLTTVFGNSTIENCTLNALRLVELEGRADIPVAKGCGEPLIIPRGEVAVDVHGEDGFGNAFLPLPRGKEIEQSAAEFIVDQIMANPGEITLVPIGPLTNIGLSLKLCPEIAQKTKEVVLMGGNAFAPGNISPVAEANIYHDPHAAELVFSAGWKVVMVGLDVTTKIAMDQDFLNRIYSANNAATDLLEKIQPCYQDFHKLCYGLSGEIHTHDPSVIAYLLDPSLFKTRDIPIFVEMSGRCMGQTVADHLQHWEGRTPTTICVEADEKGVLKLLLGLLTN